MTDVFSKRKRSHVMSRIKSTGNKETEGRFIALLKANRIIGWRRAQKLPGKPDFVFRRGKLAVFVDGCFWHGCPRCYRKPKSNVLYWAEKFQRNKKRDAAVKRKLTKLGWRVLRIWDHDLNRPVAVARRVELFLSKR